MLKHCFNQISGKEPSCGNRDYSSTIDAFLVKFGAVLSTISCLVTIGLALVMVSDVIARFVFSKPIPGVTETGSLLLGYIVFFPLSYTLALNRHIQVSFILDRMSPRTKWVSDVLIFAVGVFACALLSYFSWRYFWNSFIINERMGTADVMIPWWVSKFAVFMGFFLFFLQFVSRLILILAHPKLEEKTKTEPTASVTEVQ